MPGPVVTEILRQISLHPDLRNGTGAPSNSLGDNGNYYLDTATNELYKKAAGVYSIIATFSGTDGLDGSTWRNGSGAPSSGLGIDGDYYLNDDNGDVYEKASGSYSIVANIKGADGADGADGTNGTNGTNGADGSVWRSGSGAPAGGLGVNGDYYLNTANGDVYLKAGGSYSVVANIKGANGADGSDGADGADGADGVDGADGFVVPYGFHIELLTSSTVSVDAGITMDKTFTEKMTLADSTIDLTTIGSLGIERKTLTGTIAFPGAGRVITGTGTAFKSEFVTRNGTGTYSTSGTTVTGSGTKFLKELAVDDMIGDNTNGYSRVTAVSSDTSATIVVALPNSNASAGTSFKIIENAVLTNSDSSSSSARLESIASDTSLTLESGWVTPGASSGLTGYAGGLAYTAAYNEKLNVWVGKGSSGVTCYVSTQRTTPFGVTNYNDYVRRVGIVIWTGSANAILPMTQTGQANERTYQFENAASANGTLLVNNQAATTWTAAVASAICPPSARSLILNTYQAAPTSATYVSLRKRGAGSATVSRNRYQMTHTTVHSSGMDIVACDGAQGFDWANSQASGHTYISCAGFIEDLNK